MKKKILKKKYQFFFSLISLIIFLIVLILDINRDENNLNNYTGYYIFSFILIIIGVINFFLSQKNFKNIMTIVISIFLSLYLIEASSIIFDLNKKITQIKLEYLYFKKEGKKFDNRKKIDVYNEEKLKNKNFNFHVSPMIHLKKTKLKLLPLSGISNVDTLNCNENGYYSIIKSDRYGFNNPDKVWNKPADLILIGDSFVYGDCVNRPFDLASQMRKLNKKNVISLGIGGIGPHFKLGILKEYFYRSGKPKKVYWFFFEGNDLKDISFEKDNQILKKYFNRKNFSQNLVNKVQEINDQHQAEIENNLKSLNEDPIKTPNKFSYVNFKKFLKLYFVRQYTYKIFFPDKIKFNSTNASNSENFKIFKKIINEANNYLLNKNSQLIFVYLPELKRYKKIDYVSYKSNILNFIKKMNIQIIDIDQEVMKKVKDPTQLFPFKIHQHYNIEGYHLISKEIK